MNTPLSIFVIDSPSKTPLKIVSEPEDLLDIDYAQSDSNIIWEEFNEYFALKFVR